MLRFKEVNAPGKRTRKINPKLGYLGFLGFTGFLGIWSYNNFDKVIFPFLFFGFFGFFGFFFEGKMSNTYIDERYEQNEKRARLNAYQTGARLIWLLLVTIGVGTIPIEAIAIIVVTSLSFICALTTFLSQYLLYRYDREESNIGNSEENS